MKKKKSNAYLGESDILTLLQNRPLREQDLSQLMHLPRNGQKKLANILRELAAKGEIAKDSRGRWSLPDSPLVVEGQFLANPAGGGRVRISNPPDYPVRDIRISPYNTLGAWNKDIVRAVVSAGTQGSLGKVVDIVERQQHRVPTFLEEKRKRAWYFRPAEGRDRHLFLVRPEDTGNMSPEPGSLAILKPLEQLADQHKGRDVWSARILSLEGPGDRIAAQERIVKENHQVPGEFAPKALEQAASMPPSPDPVDLAGREDYRSLNFVTIDGADARDFDDAIQVEKIGNDYLLRVAIADVSHYVLPEAVPGSLDAEARARGNSWYFPTSVEPMLPKALSNGLCSLNPHEDRLAMLVEMRFNAQGELLDKKFAPVIINSKKRLTYDEVASYLRGPDNSLEDAHIGSMLKNAHELFRLLAARRKKRGTLDFILPEARYTFDADGRLTGMKVAERNDAHRMIEEFMIAANETVASWLGEQKIPFLYRVHPAPDPEKLMLLFNGLRALVPEMLPEEYRKPGTSNPEAIQTILANAAGTPQEFVVNRLCLRSMGQAHYYPDNIGHFGLASPAYCHFTSPIRRYADLMTHRALKAALDGKTAQLPDGQQLSHLALDLNNLERRAIEAEREISKRMSCLALSSRAGEKMTGTISAITDFGVFMEFDDLPAEGLIRMEDLGADWYEYDSTRQTLMGTRTGKIYRIGDPVSAIIRHVDMDRLEILLQTEEARTHYALQAAARRREKRRDGLRPYCKARKRKGSV